MQLQQAGSWKSATVAQGYVADSTCGRIAIAKLLSLPTSGSPNLRPTSQPSPGMMKTNASSPIVRPNPVPNNTHKPCSLHRHDDSSSLSHVVHVDSHRQNFSEYYDDKPFQKPYVITGNHNCTRVMGSKNQYQPPQYHHRKSSHKKQVIQIVTNYQKRLVLENVILPQKTLLPMMTNRHSYQSLFLLHLWRYILNMIFNTLVCFFSIYGTRL